MKTYEGPFDRETWPERLPATVVDARGERRIHGYAVRGDLVNGHGIAAIAWLALRGELPTEIEREAFEAALVYLAPVHVGETGSHAAVLARILAAQPAGLIAVAATALAEQARTEREAIDASQIEPAPTAEAIEDQRALSARMTAWFGEALPETPVLTRVACAHALLARLGFRDPNVIDALSVWARLLVVIAESMHVGLGAFRDYPARLLDYQYVDGEGHSR